jgi:hypothetical protein
LVANPDDRAMHQGQRSSGTGRSADGPVAVIALASRKDDGDRAYIGYGPDPDIPDLARVFVGEGSA